MTDKPLPSFFTTQSKPVKTLSASRSAPAIPQKSSKNPSVTGIAPPRAFVEIDVDTRDPRTGTRLLRYKTTRYLAHEQRAEIRFLYDRLTDDQGADRYVSDFDCHVYFPREVELLFRMTGFSVETWFGDYAGRRLRASSRQLIGVGLKAGNRTAVTAS